MNHLADIIDRINEGIGKCVSFLYFLIIGIMVFEVIARYVFNHPTMWAQETAIFMFGFSFIMLGGYALHQGVMVKMDIVYARFSAKCRAIFDLGTSILVFAFCIVMLWTSSTAAWKSLVWKETSQSYWNPPLYPMRVALAVGTFLLLIQLVSKFIRDLHIAIGGSSNEH